MTLKLILAGTLIGLVHQFVSHFIYPELMKFVWNNSNDPFISLISAGKYGIPEILWNIVIFILSGIIGAILLPSKNKFYIFLVSGVIGILSFYISYYLADLILTPARCRVPHNSCAGEMIEVFTIIFWLGPVVTANILLRVIRRD